MANILIVNRTVRVTVPQYPDKVFVLNDQVYPDSPYYPPLSISSYVSQGAAVPIGATQSPPTAMIEYGPKEVGYIAIWDGNYWVPTKSSVVYTQNDDLARLTKFFKDSGYQKETSAQILAAALGLKTGPYFKAERSIKKRTPAFETFCMQPTRTGAIYFAGDSTNYSNRVIYQYAKALAALMPEVKIHLINADYPNNNPWYADFKAPGDAGYLSGQSSETFNALAWAQAGHEDQYVPLPGAAGFYLQLPANLEYVPWGTRGFVGVDYSPQTPDGAPNGGWNTGTNQSILTHNSAGNGTLLRLTTNGNIALFTSPDGIAAQVSSGNSPFSITTVPNYSALNRYAVGVRFDLDTGVAGAERKYTFLYREGGEGNAWKPLGPAGTTIAQATITAAGTSAWGGLAASYWELGTAANTAGRIYEIFARNVDERGPDIIPRLPTMWTGTNNYFKGQGKGGFVLYIYNGAWPQHGLDDFCRETDIGTAGHPDAASSTFARAWDSAAPTAANVYSYTDMIPKMPYLFTAMSTAHNETSTGLQVQHYWRRFQGLMNSRAPGAQQCMFIQNASNRTDPPAWSPSVQATKPADATNTTGNRFDQDWRVAFNAAICEALGITPLDVRQDMLDYVRGGYGMYGDLMQVGGERLHPSQVGATIQALSLVNQTTSLFYDPGVTL